MEYIYYIKERKDGEPPISIVEIKDHEPGDYVTISFGEHQQVNMESNNDMPLSGRFAGKTWKAFTKCLQWAQQGKTFIYVHPRFVAIDTKTWLKLNKENIGHKIVYFEEYQPWSKEMQPELEKIKSSHAVDGHQFRQEYLGDWKDKDQQNGN